MFQFPGCPPRRLWIHLRVPGHYSGRVPPFGYPRIDTCLQFPVAFRSLPRPSSAVGAMASTLCSSLLDFTSLAPETNCFSLQQDLSCLRNLQLALISNLFLLCSCQGARFALLPVWLLLRSSFRTPSGFFLSGGKRVGRSRLELPTSRLSGECSNRLS